jgi:uridine kinase
MIAANDIKTILAEIRKGGPASAKMIAVDGRPCSGKTALAIEIADALDAEIFHVDDLFMPMQDWAPDLQPAFPFPYFRYEEFLRGVRTLSRGKVFRYTPYDWNTGELSIEVTIITPDRPVIIEGVSTLNSQLAKLYSKKIFVQSDAKTELAAAMERNGAESEKLWKGLYLPSVDLYMETNPAERADLIVAGRGL